MNNFKDLRKAAFAIGFGFTMGKFTADMLNTFISNISVIALKTSANEGNEVAQKICEENGIEIELDKKNSEIKMGFQYN